MLSILVQALENPSTPPQVRYEEFTAKLNQILGSIQDHNPVNHAKMKQKKWIGDSQIEFSNQPKEMEVASDSNVFLPRILSALDQRGQKV